jgi:hypothetical protein
MLRRGDRSCLLSCPPMALHAKVKTALNETRMLILGAQVLFGFQ